MDKRLEVAQQIYDYAREQISAYCQTSGSVSQQVTDYLMIANEVCSYLMANVLSVLPTEDQENGIQTLNSNIHSVLAYISAQGEKPLN